MSRQGAGGHGVGEATSRATMRGGRSPASLRPARIPPGGQEPPRADEGPAENPLGATPIRRWSGSGSRSVNTPGSPGEARAGEERALRPGRKQGRPAGADYSSLSLAGTSPRPAALRAEKDKHIT